jgi:RNA polymerase sigma-70 factor (ECF subfamily)
MSERPPHPDAALIEAFQQGDEFAFVSLYNQHKAGVYGFVYKMLMDRQAAQDVTQDTFIRVYEHRERLVATRAFKSWLYTIARNRCLNYLRKNGRLDPLGDSADELPGLRSPSADLERSDAIRFVNHVLARLSPEYREVLILREYQNLSYEDIAAVTRSTVSAVKSRLFKARRKMAALYREASGEPDALSARPSVPIA